jgi:hypothetical protein
MPPAHFFALVIFEIKFHFVPRPAWTMILLFYASHHSWDDSCATIPSCFCWDGVLQTFFLPGQAWNETSPISASHVAVMTGTPSWSLYTKQLIPPCFKQTSHERQCEWDKNMNKIDSFHKYKRRWGVKGDKVELERWLRSQLNTCRLGVTGRPWYSAQGDAQSKFRTASTGWYDHKFILKTNSNGFDQLPLKVS